MKDCNWATNKALSSSFWELCFTWLTISQVKPEHPLTVQLQQQFKLSWHGMEYLFRLSIIVVVVSQGLESMWVIAEGPEPVQMHIGTLFQRHAGHDQTGAGPECSEALGLPEEGQILEILWV